MEHSQDLGKWASVCNDGGALASEAIRLCGNYGWVQVGKGALNGSVPFPSLEMNPLPIWTSFLKCRGWPLLYHFGSDSFVREDFQQNGMSDPTVDELDFFDAALKSCHGTIHFGYHPGINHPRSL